MQEQKRYAFTVLLYFQFDNDPRNIDQCPKTLDSSDLMSRLMLEKMK